MRNFLLVLLFGLISAVSHAQEIDSLAENRSTPRIIGITAKNAKKSAEWYQENLGFVQDTSVYYEGSGLTIVLLHVDNFYLELIQFNQTYGKSDLGLTGPNQSLEGIIKFGFKTRNLQELYQKLKQQSITIVAPLNDLPALKVDFPWPAEHFIIEDPDGNYLQFFSGEGKEMGSEISPFMFTLAVPNLDKGLAWYKDHLQFNLIDKIIRPNNEMAILEKDGFILEMGRFNGYTSFKDIENLPEEITSNLVRGFYKVSIMTPSLKSLYDRLLKGNQSFSFALSGQKSRVGNGFFIVEDPFGNSLQFWGHKK